MAKRSAFRLMVHAAMHYLHENNIIIFDVLITIRFFRACSGVIFFYSQEITNKQ